MATIVSLAVALGAITAAPGQAVSESRNGAPLAAVRVVRTRPHSPSAFTEGLEVRGRKVFESVGLYGHSELRISDLASGRVTRSLALDPKVFAEGLAILPDGRLIQLSWKEGVAFVRDRKTLKEQKRFTLSGEGWGLCYSPKGKTLIQSDGSGTLLFRDPGSFKVTATVETTFPNGAKPTMLNELDCSGKWLFANVWQSTDVLQLDAKTGEVQQVLDASALAPATVTSPDDVLNGIASLPNGHLLLTGKRWTTSYEVEVPPLP
jgi:glutamine cyclotransferase